MLYHSRQSRNQFVATHFRDVLNGSVLNIGGGGSKHLLSYISPVTYTEIDIAGSPDIVFNLDCGSQLPLDTNSYDCVVCTDVLEHLENFHFVFSELVRVSSSDVIISLPNLANVFRSYISRSKYLPNNNTPPSHYFGKYSKYYGLPLFKPEDRHRWIFSYSEASQFFKFHQSSYGYNLISEFGPGLSGYSLFSKFAKNIISSLLPKEVYQDFFSWSYWCHLKKSSAL